MALPKASPPVCILGSVVSTAVGGLLYLSFGPEYLYVFDWARAAGLSGPVAGLRSAVPDRSTVPDWLVHNVPDALWVLASTLLLCAAWRERLCIESFLWWCLPCAMATAAEFGQAVGYVPGTFDPIDLFAYFTGALLALCIGTRKNKWLSLQTGDAPPLGQSCSRS